MATSATTPAPTSTSCTRCHEWPCICATFIGGSEVFELLNTPQYGRGCVRALAYRKLEIEQDFPEHFSDLRRALFKRGHIFEDVAAKMYTELTHRSLLRVNKLRRHRDHPGAAVHTDRMVVQFDERGTGDAEIKTHGEGPYLHILRNGLPPSHSLQLQWSMWITGHKWGTFILLGIFNEAPLKFFDVEADTELFEIFAQQNEIFWDDIRERILPAPLLDPNDRRCKLCPWRLTCRGELIDPAEMQRFMQEKKVPLEAVESEELEQALTDYALIRSEVDALVSDDEDDPGALVLVANRIKELMGETEGAIVNRKWKVYCSDSFWSGLDIQRLKQEQPELYERYFISRRPTGGKRLRVAAIKEKW